MGNERKEDRLLDTTTKEFKDYLNGKDSSADPTLFLSMVWSMASKGFKTLPDNATEAKKEGRRRNINHIVSVMITHDPKPLLVEYYNLHTPDSVAAAYDEDHFERYLGWERHYASKAGFDPIEVTPMIDRPGPNGMTRLASIIMISDNVAQVKILIEEEGASPVAKCGGILPSELAGQLGRHKILGYLRDLGKNTA